MSRTSLKGAGAPGEILDDELLVACGEGSVRLTRVQREGRAAQPAADLLKGFPLPAGSVLG
jgi:methionyl-tRNA formyltransferase